MICCKLICFLSNRFTKNKILPHTESHRAIYSCLVIKGSNAANYFLNRTFDTKNLLTIVANTFKDTTATYLYRRIEVVFNKRERTAMKATCLSIRKSLKEGNTQSHFLCNQLTRT